MTSISECCSSRCELVNIWFLNDILRKGDFEVLFMVTQQDRSCRLRYQTGYVDPTWPRADHKDGVPRECFWTTVVMAVQCPPTKRFDSRIFWNGRAVIQTAANKHSVKDMRFKSVVDEIFDDYLKKFVNLR